VSEFKPRERGIYVLPDGTEFVVCDVGGGGWNLYLQEDWNSFFPLTKYRAHPDGRIFLKGDVTPWRLSDLEDTGRTAKYLASIDKGDEQLPPA
jgi:hypothetical protein